PGSLQRVEVDRHPFAVIVTAEGKPHVIDDLCTHANARLSEGWLEEGCVACPWHGAQFDLESG
ncbi:MAG: Rieske 2Fe-2S domain-containing protein, partial [Verrucomicrobiales bacterium]